MADDSSSNSRTRLNPFAFPSDTDFRFEILIVMVLSTSVYIYTGLQFLFSPDSQALEREFKQCFPNPSEFPHTTNTPGNLSEFLAPMEACLAPMIPTSKSWVMGRLAGVIALAFIFYYFYPVWKIRRDRLVALSEEDAPEVVSSLEELCERAGLPSHPMFLMQPLNDSCSGVAFGRLGRYYVSLSGGLIVKFRTDFPAFRAVVLHELAHLRNADVDKTYLTVSIWWAVVVISETALKPVVEAWPRGRPAWLSTVGSTVKV